MNEAELSRKILRILNEKDQSVSRDWLTEQFDVSAQEVNEAAAYLESESWSERHSQGMGSDVFGYDMRITDKGRQHLDHLKS